MMVIPTEHFMMQIILLKAFKMKTNIQAISQQWENMLPGNTIPCFELELKDGEFLLVDLELFADLEEIRFSFDSMNLKTWFSGNIKEIHDCKFALPITEFDDNLDELLQVIYQEISEGFILPNDLFPREEN
jgi:hypothetical protein